MKIGEAIGIALTQLGVKRVFGVVGSGNFHVTCGLVKGGAEFVAARHEGGAATMADSYARMSGEVGVVSVHQGCGLSNAITGIAEAAKSRTPLLILSGEVLDPASNFYIDQDALAQSVGAVSLRARSAATALSDLANAFSLSVRDRRTVLFNLPLNVQDEICAPGSLEGVVPLVSLSKPGAAPGGVAELVEVLKGARRPVFIAGRGARGAQARQALQSLADDVGALVAEGAVAKGLFEGYPWSIGVSGGFSSPLTVELIRNADVVVGWGTTLNKWTTRHGSIIGKGAALVQVDLEARELAKNRPVALGIVGDVAVTAKAASDSLREQGYSSSGYRSAEIAARIKKSVLWRDVDYEDDSTGSEIDPRTLSIVLDDIIPKNRVLGVDSGNFLGYPSMYLKVPDENSFSFTQAFQCVGLGLATAIGAAFAQPERFPVAACGDGGFLMGISELETAVRLKLGMLIIVYNDHAYGAEVYHFGPQGHPVETVTFPDTDIASIARGYGADGVTVRTRSDLERVADLLSQGLERPLVIDAKVTKKSSWWLEEAMKEH
ncbi:thiamine pyrophosphate-binding protein [Agrobacterium tumefaciens]|uniref:thiamine pyrophosphate-binding protein n=1 Tax=Agrobacterium tumefaciens TaxID=358 RepID=UPI00287D320F|nr:thiamine pyrophosphate-binding protein [Agrobacterium tumefaciens]MDS7593954.1 thiamine pyrophosphate-binding protein [Agrobacterium tumefaciens]